MGRERTLTNTETETDWVAAAAAAAVGVSVRVNQCHFVQSLERSAERGESPGTSTKNTAGTSYLLIAAHRARVFIILRASRHLISLPTVRNKLDLAPVLVFYYLVFYIFSQHSHHLRIFVPNTMWVILQLYCLKCLRKKLIIDWLITIWKNIPFKFQAGIGNFGPTLNAQIFINNCSSINCPP